jgi:two-component system response regulator GlrR
MLRLLKKPRVLLLDDDASMQRLLALMLRREGFRVDAVSTGRQAIEKIGRVEYDALLLDLMMPTEGGMTVIRHLREHDPRMLRRVVVVTASPDSVLKKISKEVAAVVKKPVDAGELIAAIRK